MSMNLNEGGHYVINCSEDLTAIDFDSNVSLAEKLVRHGTCTAEWMVVRIVRPQRATTDRGEESAPMTESWSGAVDSVVETLVDARAGNGECYYLPTWEQDAKMVGSSRSGLGSPALMLRLLPRRVCSGRGCRWGGLCIAAAAEEN
ncbi:hypothetical protein B296_00007266 [Ensete ventricosum]|uniref:Uncharacterized protein n=1 Tax=Ensete ventricosum TaxID=4639 RepID=A0A427ACI8_ENSVE|nr:hypothetical protein B296_00007266 [Ensete ventricosum]